MNTKKHIKGMISHEHTFDNVSDVIAHYFPNATKGAFMKPPESKGTIVIVPLPGG